MSSKLYGYDVSSYQRNLNIKSVKSDFVIVKATGGTSYVNPYCNHHVSQTLKAGKLLGLYHYAHENKVNHYGKTEARYFVKNIKNYVGKAMLVLDYEEPLNHSYYTKKDVLWIMRFCREVKKLTGVTPVLYISKSVINQLNFKPVTKLNVGLWYAQYPNNNPVGYISNPWTDNKGFGSFKGAIMHQYTSTGRLTGYNGFLDLNLFYGSKSAWKAYCKPTK